MLGRQFFIKLILLLTIFSCETFTGLALADISSFLNSSDTKKVLLLNSYHKGYIWTDEITRGVEETLEKKDVELHIEYMDSKRQFDTDLQALLIRVLRLKHLKHEYDVIIASDNNAFDFLKKFEPQIFKNVPIIFCGVNYLQEKDVTELANYTGVNEKVDIVNNLALIRKLHPDQAKITVITDNTTTGKKIQQEVKRAAALRENKDLIINLLYDVSIQELKKRVQAFDNQTIVLFTIFARDKNDVFLEYEQGMNIVCRNKSVPIYAVQNFTSGIGIIGGHQVFGYDQGIEAAKKANKIITGTPVDLVPISWDTPTRARFNYKQLQRHNIDSALLPPNSEILYQPVSFYHQHKKFIWNLIIVFSLLLTALLGVIYSLIRSWQAEKKLKQSEEKYRITLHSIGDAVIATDTCGNITKMNPVAEKLTGWSFEEAFDKPLHQVFHIVNAKTRKPIINPVQQVLENNKIVGLANHTILIAKNGLEYQIADSAAPIKNSQNIIQGVVLVFYDVTKEYEMREKIFHSEKRYRTMMESMEDPILICSPDFHIEYMNPAMIRRTGYDATGEVCYKAMHNLDEKCSWCVCKKVLKGNTLHYEITSPKDNKTYHIANSPIVHSDGSVSKLTVYRDVTNIKKADKALRENEEKFRSLIESAPAGIVICDENETITMWNNSAENIFGFTADEIIGKNVSLLMPKTYYTMHHEGLQHLAASGQGKHIGKALELEGKRKDGSIFPLELSISTWKLLEDRFFAVIVYDISERQELETRLQQAQKLETIGTLAGGIAHDFNNILFPILGHAEMLLNDLSNEDPSKESVQEIHVSALRAKDLVQQILTFSRQEKNEMRLMKIQPILNEVLKMIRSTIPATIDISSRIEKRCGVIKADPTQIHQLIMNLLTNAYHSIEENVGKIKVQLSRVELDQQALANPDMIPGLYNCLAVSDTGIGMVESVKKRIFEPFFTTKEHGKGTGLGLSVAHGIVKSMNGGIRVLSKPGKGTEILVYFPIQQSSFARNGSGAKNVIQKGVEKILLVDDEKPILQMVQRVLERLGYKVSSRISSIEALEAFRSNPDKYDLVITDLAMPKMPGDKLAVELLKIKPDIPIILNTGFSDKITPELAKKQGIKGVLMKPIVMKDLTQMIRDIIDRQE